MCVCVCVCVRPFCDCVWDRREGMDACGTSLVLILLFWLGAGSRAADIYWTYSGQMGQPQWSEFFPDCGGSGQSPINVDSAQTKFEPRLPAIRPLGYSQHSNEPFTLSNNGHTVVMPLPSWMGIGGLPWQFSAVQLHLHWGNGASVATGSEHTINGRSTAAELHIVHYNSELYENISMAMTQRDGLAVLGVLMEVGEETNQAYANIINYLSRIRHAGDKVTIPAFDIQTLLPKDLRSYYRYNGSLTTPPCYQSVLWTVFQETVKLSLPQLVKLETLLYSTEEGSSDPLVLQDNYRATQPLNQRVVLASFKHRVKVYNAGEIAAIVMGSLCGCVGLAVIIRFIIKTIRSKDMEKALKQDMALKTATESSKSAEPTQSEP
ncbi:carbonic anhydrase 14 isoform X4 [Alosa alosa]|uniref:carbonic anhydrase 14 isoform X4 n=1 Tax=Alosa alosa TaxID=278164 RepID=UPI00201530FD|nr:carbonic anhydrase 14 isoform X4 [Alosa alosa]